VVQARQWVHVPRAAEVALLAEPSRELMAGQGRAGQARPGKEREREKAGSICSVLLHGRLQFACLQV
jgi:hypothetical protein